MIREMVTGEELLSLGDAKRWLKIDGDYADVDIEQAIREARAYCERQSAQTFRSMVRYESVMPTWPNERGTVRAVEDRPQYHYQIPQRMRYYLPHPPYVPNTLVDVCYVASGLEKSFTAHRVICSGTSQSYVEADENASLPSIDCRDDAVRIRWFAGSLPGKPDAGQVLCLKHVLRAVWDGDIEGKTWEFFDTFLQRFTYGHYA